jgi:uncharacterized protein
VRRRIVLLARVPRAGAVKTRLAAAIGDPAALTLYRAFLEDQIAFLASFPVDHAVEWCADGDAGPELAALVSRTRVRMSPQVAGDLGARLAAVFERKTETGPTATVVIGADSPTLPSRLVEESLDHLTAAGGAVVVPADDGGYVLVGLCRPAPALFRDVPWSSSVVLERTRERARTAGVDLAEIGSWYDVDDRASLRRLVVELARPRATERAPCTARAILDLSLGRMV